MKKKNKTAECLQLYLSLSLWRREQANTKANKQKTKEKERRKMGRRKKTRQHFTGHS
jgi:hypothetical protein